MRIFKKEFPLTKSGIYLNYGSCSPIPQSALENMHDYLEERSILGPYHPRMNKRYIDDLEMLRKQISEYVNGCLDEIAILHNTTESINAVINGFSWSERDEVVTTTLEHEAVRIPLVKLQQEKRIRVRKAEINYAKDKEGIVEKFRKVISPKTKMIVFSNIDFMRGIVFPAKEICKYARQNSIFTLIDGAQAAGVLPIDVKKIDCDSYCFCGHKWMMGPEGLGFLYLNEKYGRKVVPTTVGYCSQNRSRGWKDIIYQKGARRFEYSSWSGANITCMLGVLRFLERFDRQENADYIKELTTIFKTELEIIPEVEVLTPKSEDLSLGIVSFRIYDIDQREFVKKLCVEKNIICRYVYDIDCVRICVHFLNNRKDMLEMLSFIKKAA